MCGVCAPAEVSRRCLGPHPGRGSAGVPACARIAVCTRLRPFGWPSSPRRRSVVAARGCARHGVRVCTAPLIHVRQRPIVPLSPRPNLLVTPRVAVYNLFDQRWCFRRFFLRGSGFWRSPTRWGGTAQTSWRSPAPKNKQAPNTPILVNMPSSLDPIRVEIPLWAKGKRRNRGQHVHLIGGQGERYALGALASHVSSKLRRVRHACLAFRIPKKFQLLGAAVAKSMARIADGTTFRPHPLPRRICRTPRPELGPGWPVLARGPTESACWPTSTRSQPNFGDSGQSWPRFGPIWPGFAQTCATSIDFGPRSAHIGRVGPRSVGMWPSFVELARFWPLRNNSGVERSLLGRAQPKIVQTRPNLVEPKQSFVPTRVDAPLRNASPPPHYSP